MKTKMLKTLAPIRDTRPLNGYLSCLPPVRRVPVPKAPFGVVEAQLEWDAMTADAPELLKLEPAVALLRDHDWTFRLSDDVRVYRRGVRREEAMREELAKLTIGQAEFLWGLYAPVSMGRYSR